VMINGLGGLGDLRPFASLCNTEAQNSSRTPLGQPIFLAVALHRGLAINGLRPAGIAHHGSYGSGVYGTLVMITRLHGPRRFLASLVKDWLYLYDQEK
jgi:hypothetical protein